MVPFEAVHCESLRETAIYSVWSPYENTCVELGTSTTFSFILSVISSAVSFSLSSKKILPALDQN